VQETGTPELIAAVERGQVSVSAAADVATLPQEQQAEIVAKGEKDILAAAKEIREKRGAIRREERVNRINEIALGNQPLSGSMDRLFPVVYADPPWRYEHSQTANREIENHYPTMTLEEICALPVGDIVTPDSILFLWTTSPKLEESMQVIAAWGFTYRTCLVWVKDKIGMGYYARQRHELLLVAKRGSIPVPDTDARFDSVIECPRVEHSKKPDVVYGMIDKMYPHFDKVELFARQTTDGWYTWGNQS
jgi:N6-adenosine-specific RNA methylase IME4